MKKILKLSGSLYVDLETGDCRGEEMPMQGEAPCRLTGGQLKILGCLVRNQGHVCTWDMLEGLFDSEAGDGRLSATKNHISRLKKALCSVDPGFGQETAGKVFQSVHGRGYMFCMPKHGRVIEVKTPVDGIVQVDWEFVKSQKLEPGLGLENLKNIFYGITSDREVLLQAVCNGIHILDANYQKLLKEFSRYVFAPGHPVAPVYLMADGGSGKSTLLCQFAVQASKDHPGWNVMYLDISNLGSSKDTFRQIFSYLYQNGISRTRKNVLCVDSPHENPDGFRELYQILTEEKNPYIYLLVAERASLMMNLLESDKVFQRDSYIRGFYIGNGEEGDGASCFRSSFVQFADVKRYLLPQELKAEVVGKMVAHFAGRRKLDGEIVGKSISALTYGRKTISDVFMDFKRNYNWHAKKHGGTESDSYIPQISMDWDEWSIKCRPLDAGCTGLKLSEAFPYIAACYLFGVKVTYGFIKKMTGYPYKSVIQRLFPQGMGEGIQFAKGRLVLRHDTVADNYFAFHPEISLQEYMEEIISESYLDKEATGEFLYNVFPFSSCRNPGRAPYGLDLRKLMRLFRANAEYMEYVGEDCRTLAVSELSYIILSHNLDAAGEKDEELQEAFSDSFQYVLGKITEEGDKLGSWIRYFSMSLWYCGELPDALAEFARGSDLKHGIEREGILKSLLNRAYRKKYIFMDMEWEERLRRFGDKIFEGGWKERERVLNGLYIGVTDENCLDLMYLILSGEALFEQPFTEEDVLKYSKEQLEGMIPQKKNGLDLRKLFGQWLHLPDRCRVLIIFDNEKEGEKNGKYYLFYVIQQLLQNHIYEEPYNTLMGLDYGEMEAEGEERELCISLGMVYSLFPGDNPYYSPELAIAPYERALALSREGKRMGDICLSLANLHYACKHYKEARAACEKATGHIDWVSMLWRDELLVKISQAEGQEP